MSEKIVLLDRAGQEYDPSEKSKAAKPKAVHSTECGCKVIVFRRQMKIRLCPEHIVELMVGAKR